MHWWTDLQNENLVKTIDVGPMRLLAAFLLSLWSVLKSKVVCDFKFAQNNDLQ